MYLWSKLPSRLPIAFCLPLWPLGALHQSDVCILSTLMGFPQVHHQDCFIALIVFVSCHWQSPMHQHAPFLPFNQVMSTWTSQHALSTSLMPALLSLSHAVHLVIMSAQPSDVYVVAIWWYSAVRQLARHPRSTFLVIVAIHGLCTFCQCSQHPDLLSPLDTLLAISTFRTLRPIGRPRGLVCMTLIITCHVCKVLWWYYWAHCHLCINLFFNSCMTSLIVQP